MDLSSFLVEKEVIINAAAMDTQTNGFEPMPEEAPYIPKKGGIDAATQMTAEEQPFQFDREVTPLLEVVVQKTIEQALTEVEQEAELGGIAAYLEELRANQEAEAARVKAIESETCGSFRAKMVRRKAEKDRMVREAAVRAKVAGVKLMKQNWPGMLEAVSRGLEGRGSWCDPTTWTIRAEVLPWLYQGVADDLSRSETARRLVDGLLDSVIENHTYTAAAEKDAREASLAALADEEAKKAGWIRIFLDVRTLFRVIVSCLCCASSHFPAPRLICGRSFRPKRSAYRMIRL
jgi:hypothetical protein